MEDIRTQLLDTLQNLTNDDFEGFKWYLKTYKVIPEGKLDGADRRRTVDLLVETYPDECVDRTIAALKGIKRNDLADQLRPNDPAGSSLL